jgi:hypothetical protein
VDERCYECDHRLQRARIRLPDFNRDWTPWGTCIRAAPRRRAWILQLCAEILQHFGGLLERAASRSRAAHVLDLLAQGRLILGQVRGELVRLSDDHGADAEYRRERDEHDRKNSQYARDVQRLKNAHERREDKAKQNCERDRH